MIFMDERLIIKAKEKVLSIENYCKTYDEWVRIIHYPVDESEKLCSSLYIWLKSSGYFKNNFKYKDIVGSDGISLQDKLDNLYNEYKNKISRRKRQYLEKIVESLENYCNTHKKLPTFIHNPKSYEDYFNNSLYFWLLDYTKGKFKYGDVYRDDGVLYKDIIDELYNTYYRTPDERKQNIKKEMLLRIKNYCLKNNKFPSRTDKPETEAEKETAKLYNWIKDNKNTGAEFINSLKTLFGGLGTHGLSGDDGVINIWKAYKSNNKVLIIYYYITEIYYALRNDKKALFKYCVDYLKEFFEIHKIDLDVSVFINLFYASPEEQKQYFFEEYIKYSLANNKLSLLFKNLYSYVVITNLEVTDELVIGKR